MPLCRLCHLDRELRNSHIVPEFLHDGLYNKKGHHMAINGKGNRGWQPLQKGIREHLFCEECEQHFNKHFEMPFRAQWVQAFPLPNPWEGDICWGRFHYASFKLFHLSVLFRASVSSLPSFSEVSLGTDEETLRKLLLSVNPGEPWQYPIFGQAIIHHKTKRVVAMVSRTVESGFEGYRCYGTIYGGVQWWVGVSAHRHLEFESACLQPDGRMPFCAIPWNEIQVIQLAARALRESDRKHES